MNRHRALAFVLLGAVLGSAVFAQADDEEPQPADDAGATAVDSTTLRENIVVTATRTARHVEDLPVSVTVLDEERIEMAPALTSDELLRDVPSFNLPLVPAHLQHPTANSVSMRGLGGQRVLLMLDSVPLNDPFFGFVSWEKVPVETIGRVEVARGGSSSLFGSYALGGAVNLLTRPADERALRADAGYGSLATAKANLYASGRVGESLALSGNFNGYRTDGYVKIAPEVRGAADVATSSRSGNAQLRADWEGVERHAFARLNVFGNEQDLETRLSHNSRDIFDLATGADWRIGGRSELQTRLFYEDNRAATTNTDFVDPSSRDEVYVSNVHDTPATDLGGSVQWTSTFGDWAPHVTLGADLRRIRGEDRSKLYDAEGAFVGIEDGGGRQRFAGVFGEVSLAPHPRLEVLLSGRYDTWRNEGFESTTAGGSQTFPDRDESRFDPRLAVRWQLTSLSALRGSVYRAFRAPTLDNLYRRFTASGFALLPNPELGAETMTGGEVGYDVFGDSYHAEVNVFRNTVRDLIGTRIVSFFPVFTIEQINVGETRSEGVELIGSWSLTPAWTLDGSYVHTHTEVLENAEDPSRVGGPAAGVPDDRIDLGIRYQRPGGLAVALRGRHLSEQLDEFTGGTLEEHAVLDASVTVPVGGRLELHLVGNNLLDETYVANNFGGPQLGPPRTVFAGVRWASR